MVEDMVLEGTTTTKTKSKSSSSNRYRNEKVMDTKTLGGWCLVDALWHCAKASNGILEPFLQAHE